MRQKKWKQLKGLPSQMCHGRRLPTLTSHAIRPPQQSQRFDSKLDLRCHSKPEMMKSNSKHYAIVKPLS